MHGRAIPITPEIFQSTQCINSRINQLPENPVRPVSGRGGVLNRTFGSVATGTPAKRLGLERSIQEILAEARNLVFERYGKPVRADVTGGWRRKTAGECQ